MASATCRQALTSPADDRLGLGGPRVCVDVVYLSETTCFCPFQTPLTRISLSMYIPQFIPTLFIKTDAAHNFYSLFYSNDLQLTIQFIYHHYDTVAHYTPRKYLKLMWNHLLLLQLVFTITCVVTKILANSVRLIMKIVIKLCTPGDKQNILFKAINYILSTAENSRIKRRIRDEDKCKETLENRWQWKHDSYKKRRESWDVQEFEK